MEKFKNVPAKVLTQPKTEATKRPASACPCGSGQKERENKRFVRENIKDVLSKDKQIREHKQSASKLETSKANKQAKKLGVIPTYLRKFRQEEEQERLRT